MTKRDRRSRSRSAILGTTVAVLVAACSSDRPTPLEPCAPNCTPTLPGSWSNGAQPAQPRREAPAALLNGRIYVAGGFDDARVTFSGAEVFDPLTGSWSAVPDMPGARHHNGAAVIDDRLYIVGGYSTLGTNWNTVNTLFAFDAAANAWRLLAPLPDVRGAMGVAAAEGKLYAFGGAAHGTESTTTFIYDPQTDGWSAGAPMPTAREHVLAATIGSTIYVAGGRRLGGGNMAVLEAYSPETDSWQTLAPMQHARSGHAMAAMGGRLYVFGGEDLLTGLVLSQVEEYDPATNTWRDMTPMSVPLTGAAAVATGAGIHIVGGSDRSGTTRRIHLIFRP